MLANCSSSDDGGGEPTVPTFIPPTVSTAPAGNINGLSVTLNGNISATGAGVASYGFCIGDEANPSMGNGNDMTLDNYGSHSGNFSQTVNLDEPNKTYHVRAYATTSTAFGQVVTYGADVTFTTNYPFQIKPVKNIVSNAATFSMDILSVPVNAYKIGICYGTNQNPTVTNGEILEFSQATGYQESGNIPLIDPLTPDTMYHARAFYEFSNNVVFYGPQVSFRSAGYFGPAGGYVAFDKGETIDGWRYIEVSPIEALYNGNNPQWGCYGSFVSNTSPQLGTGLANTTTVVSGCNAANCAARLCYNFTRNGFTDWYLGSRDEMLIILNSLKGINVNIQSCWTSSEITAGEAYRVTFNGPYIISAARDKSYSDYVFPIRRY